ncbi:MAG: dockerin type I domain-containing protein, partial [bacterium]
QFQVDNSPVKFAIYSGDVNQDGVIDGSDAAIIDNDAYNFITGYVESDVNGDGIVDGSDAIIVDNNIRRFVSVIRP